MDEDSWFEHCDLAKQERERLVKELTDQKELMQDDLLCILDGIGDQSILNKACQVIVDRINILIAKVKE